MGHPVYIAIDFETAGYYGHSACALGMARIENSEIVDEFYSLIRPPSSRVYFTKIHGLRWQDLKDAEDFAHVWPKAQAFISGAQYFVAHNAPFDKKVLQACCETFFQEQAPLPFLCTLRGARRALKLPSYSLNNVCAYFGIDLEHHHAASDARACALIFARLLKRGMDISAMYSGGAIK